MKLFFYCVMFKPPAYLIIFRYVSLYLYLSAIYLKWMNAFNFERINIFDGHEQFIWFVKIIMSTIKIDQIIFNLRKYRLRDMDNNNVRGIQISRTPHQFLGTYTIYFCGPLLWWWTNKQNDHLVINIPNG